MQIIKAVTFIKPYAFSTTAIIFITLFLTLLNRWLNPSLAPFVFLAAIICIAWYGNLRSGILAVILSSISIYYFFLSPQYTFINKQVSGAAELLLFVIEGGFLSYFVSYRRMSEDIHIYKQKEHEDKKIINELKKKLHSSKEETILRDEFLSIASHELKTPLTTVVMQIQTTLHNIRNVSLSEFSVEHLLRVLQSMQNQTKRLSQMINDLLNISLITTHKMTLEIEDVDLATMIHDIADSFAEKLGKEGIDLSVSIKDSLVGRWDKLRLEQVMDNLISNAIKYGNKKPIAIELGKHDGYAIIKVIDKGIGIKDNEKDDIFSLFKRGTFSEKDYKGLGIGLYIAQQIIKLHNGKIEVKSKHGDGTTFTIFLPLK